MGFHLQELAQALASGDEFNLIPLKEELAKLNEVEAVTIFNFLIEKARKYESWSEEPPELKGIYYLCPQFPLLQEKLIVVFNSTPLKELGLWAAAPKSQVFTDPGINTQFETLQTKWAEQNENLTLKKAMQKIKKLKG